MAERATVFHTGTAPHLADSRRIRRTCHRPAGSHVRRLSLTVGSCSCSGDEGRRRNPGAAVGCRNYRFHARFARQGREHEPGRPSALRSRSNFMPCKAQRRPGLERRRRKPDGHRGLPASPAPHLRTTVLRRTQSRGPSSRSSESGAQIICPSVPHTCHRRPADVPHRSWPAFGFRFHPGKLRNTCHWRLVEVRNIVVWRGRHTISGDEDARIRRLGAPNSETTFEADRRLVGFVQRGLKSRGYASGPLVENPPRGPNSGHSIKILGQRKRDALTN